MLTKTEMNIFGVKKFSVITAFAVFLAAGIAGFGLIKAFEPAPARAQCSCGNLCTSAGGGISTAIAAVSSSQVVVEIYNVYTTVNGLYNGLMDTYNSVISGSLLDTGSNQKSWFENFVAYDLTPSMKDQTAQMNTMLIDQTRQLASAKDAEQLNKTMRAYEDAQFEARRESEPSESVCVAGTMSGGFARAKVVTKELERALPEENAGVSGNVQGSPAEAGEGPYQLNRRDRYVACYCNPDANNGNGCFGEDSGPFVDQDILVEETLFKGETIDIKSTPGKREAIRDLIANLVEPTTNNIVPPSAMDSVEGRNSYLNLRATRAQRNMAKKTITDIVARRAPGSRMADYVQSLRSSAGVDLTEISPNPSWNEMVTALSEERFWSGVYNMDNVTQPEAVSREQVALQTLELLQMSEYMDSLNNIAMLTASQTAQQAIENKGYSNLSILPSSDEE